MQHPRGKNRLQRLELCDLGTLLPSTALKPYPWIITVATQLRSRLVLFGRSCSVGIIFFSGFHFTTLYRSIQPSTLCKNVNLLPCRHTTFYYVALEKLMLLEVSICDCILLSLALMQLQTSAVAGVQHVKLMIEH